MMFRPMTFLAAAAALALSAGIDASAHAACALPPLAGDWERIGPVKDQDLTRIEIIHRCTPNQHRGYAVLPGHVWTVRAFSKCRPRDCKWGRVHGEVDDAGVLTAEFRTFIARRYLRVEPAGDAVRIDVFIDYLSEKRESEKATLTFVRAR